MPPGSSLTLNSLQLLNKTEKISARYILYLLFHLCVKFCICGIKITPGSTTAAAPALAPQVCLSSLLFILCNRFKLLLATRVFLQTGTWPLSSQRAENDSLGVKAAASAETGASCPLEDAAAVSPKEREWILPCRVCRGTSQAICHSRHVSVCVWGGGGDGMTGKWSHRNSTRDHLAPPYWSRGIGRFQTSSSDGEYRPPDSGIYTYTYVL